MKLDGYKRFMHSLRGEELKEETSKELRVGSRVMIAETSRYYGTDDANPSGVEGYVDYTDAQDSSEDLPIGVQWDNGTNNAYSEEDLVVL